MSLLATLKKLKKSRDPYQPLIEVLVYKRHILHNLAAYQKLCPGVAFAPVLKSNAYGHGLIEVAQILEDYNQGKVLPSPVAAAFKKEAPGQTKPALAKKNMLPFFMVDSLFEARALRHEGIKTPLLILGYTTAENINSQKLNAMAFAVISLEQLKILDKTLRRPANFHLKIDTGMRRQGLMPDELTPAVEIIKNNPKIKIEGICSHLADADNPDKSFTQKQIALWNNLVTEAEKSLGQITYKHLANTAGAAFGQEINANVSRLGIGLYGFKFSPHLNLDLKPALGMRSVISSVRTLKAGEGVGYNVIFKADKDMKVATVPVGYTEGFDRRLSNAGSFVVAGKVCPIVGRVSMNITSIDVSEVADARLGQMVTLISPNPADVNSIENIAKICGTIAYEILVHIPAFLKRVVI